RSQCSAADLWDLRATTERKIDVIVPTHRRGDRDVAPHRGTIGSADQTTRQGIPVTVPLRTILDLAAVIPERELEAAVRQAVYHRLTTTALLAEAVQARPGRRGTKKLRNVLVHMGEA